MCPSDPESLISRQQWASGPAKSTLCSRPPVTNCCDATHRATGAFRRKPENSTGTVDQSRMTIPQKDHKRASGDQAPERRPDAEHDNARSRRNEGDDGRETILLMHEGR